MLLGMTAASFMLSAYTTDAEANNEDLSVQAMAEGQAGQPAPQTHWQGEASFPDWMGTPSDTLALNSMYSYLSYHGQGTVQVSVADEVEDFSLYINGHHVDTSTMMAGGTYDLDVSELAVNGVNTLQVSNICPYGLSGAVTVRVPYPVVLAGDAAEEGINPQTLQMVSDLIATDIEHGFTSAQLAIVRNGRLVYENAWGRCNSYLPNGAPNTNSPLVTTSTLYDLASNSKMYSVNYALQLLVSEQKVDLDARICEFLGDEFVSETILTHDSNGKLLDMDLDTIKAWKANLTIRDLLRHQGGFPPDPQYFVPYYRKENLAKGESHPANDLFAGNGADEATRAKTLEMINKTPLKYEPGTKTVYSDVDYMVLGLVVEKVTGTDLDTFLKQTFFGPMGLDHITYNPLKAGFSPDDCAATELNGNTRDHSEYYEGYRTHTLQGEVHDEKAYYNMAGVSGHAGLFASATNLATLASVMLTGGYGEHRFFSKDVMDAFVAPKSEKQPTWGLGWYRNADAGRPKYFGTQSSRGTVGHQGWTGTLTMIDPSRNLVVAYLTNKINSPVTDVSENPDRFDGNWYTAATLGFIPQIISIGMDTDQDVSCQLLDLAADMAVESTRLIPESAKAASDHPSVKNFESKCELFEKLADGCADADRVLHLRDLIEQART
jgi:CubicO group peptidase (beta-lactamase class C family)